MRSEALRLRTTSMLALFGSLSLACGCDGRMHAPGDPRAGSPTPSDPACTAETDLGSIRGAGDGETCSFKGIPYAAPPVGRLRFRPPQPASPPSEARAFTDFGAPCMQSDYKGGTIGSEDCLTLNVWTPKVRSGLLPVLFFVHGGSNVTGSSSDFSDGAYLYDGSYLAEHGPAVVVTINYRLGSLGYLVIPALAAESPDGVSGNYGILDQIAALTWVKHNIERLGGDPDRVLAFGQSAGAGNVCVLAASPLAAGLFERAMMLSGNCYASTAADARTAGLGVVAAVGCEAAANVASCLRSKDAAEIALAPVDFAGRGRDSGFNGPNVDGALLPDQPLTVFRDGQHQHMPMIFSTTANEVTSLVGLPGIPRVTTAAQYRAEIARLYGAGSMDEILALYPSDSFASPENAYIALLTDDWYTCPNRSELRAVATSQSEPIWRALFVHTFEQGPYRKFRAGHGMDLFFGFHTFGTVPASTAELDLAGLVGDAWVRFAATGDPNSADAVDWPPYDPGLDNALQLGIPPAMTARIHSARCDFWDDYNGR